MSPNPLQKCRECRRYTLKPLCPSCGQATGNPGPARYSPEDRWGKYRRQLRATASPPPRG